MKKYLYMSVIMLLQTLHGQAVALAQWNLASKILILSVPIGFFTGLLFALLEEEIKRGRYED